MRVEEYAASCLGQFCVGVEAGRDKLPPSMEKTTCGAFEDFEPQVSGFLGCVYTVQRHMEIFDSLTWHRAECPEEGGGSQLTAMKKTTT